LLKTLTTGAGGQKPSEVILNQFKLHGIDVPEDVRQRIQTRQTPAPTRYEYDNATTYAHATTHDN